MSESITAKVCFVVPNLYPLFNRMAKSPYSGAEVQLYELARFFGNEDGIEISIVTGDFGQEDVEFDSGCMLYRSRFQPKKKVLWQRWFSKEESIDDVLKQTGADVYFMSGPSTLCLAVAEFCKRYRRGFVYRVSHQRECDRSYVQSKGEEGEKFQEALQMADTVVCQTQEQKLLLKRTTNKSAQVIPNAIPVPPYQNAGRYDVLWCGIASAWKQPELFMRLALTLPEHSFTMISSPDGEEYFEKLVSSTRDVPNLGFQNSVPYQELHPFLQRAKVMVNTSRFEGFPFTFTQALAQGIPVVSLNVDPDGLLSQHQMGIHANGSEKQLVESVHDLLGYPRQWQRYSDHAYQFASQFANIETIAKDYRLLFYKLVVSKRRK